MKAFKKIGFTTSHYLSEISKLSAKIPEDFNKQSSKNKKDKALSLLNHINQGFPLKTGLFVSGTSEFGLNPDQESLIVGATDVAALYAAIYGGLEIYYSFEASKWMGSISGEDDMPVNVLSGTVEFVKWTRGRNDQILDRADQIYSEVKNTRFITYSLVVLMPDALPELVESLGETVPESWLGSFLPKP